MPNDVQEGAFYVMLVLDLRFDIEASYKKAKENSDSELFWEAHLVQRKVSCHIEQLNNQDDLPVTGFKIAVFPLKIIGASVAPARVLAIVECIIKS